MNIKRYSKAIGAGLGALAAGFGVAAADGVITGPEVGTWAAGVVGAVLAALAAPKNAERSGRGRRDRRGQRVVGQ